MLVLGRREMERIRIGDNIVVTVLDKRGKFTRIGVQAPVDTPIHREELWQKMAGRGEVVSLASDPLAETIEQIRKLCLARNNASVNLGAHQLASDILQNIGGAE